VRDLALFVGNPHDVVPDTFGPGLPPIRQWVEAHYRFPGYIQYIDPRRYADPSALRARFGFRPEERVVVATVGGTAVGATLLRRIIESFLHARRQIPTLRLIAVAGPRIDPNALPVADGVEVRAYVPDLYEQLAACDLALVQGGLSTTMELVTTGRPFIYFPLHRHFEQTFHVPHRLANYGVSPAARMDFAATTTERLADRIVAAQAQPHDYRPVEVDGAARAARLIAELL
jgi:predicted glycosyltransferase